MKISVYHRKEVAYGIASKAMLQAVDASGLKNAFEGYGDELLKRSFTRTQIAAMESLPKGLYKEFNGASINFRKDLGSDERESNCKAMWRRLFQEIPGLELGNLKLSFSKPVKMPYVKLNRYDSYIFSLALGNLIKPDHASNDYPLVNERNKEALEKLANEIEAKIDAIKDIGNQACQNYNEILNDLRSYTTMSALKKGWPEMHSHFVDHFKFSEGTQVAIVVNHEKVNNLLELIKKVEKKAA